MPRRDLNHAASHGSSKPWRVTCKRTERMTQIPRLLAIRRLAQAALACVWPCVVGCSHPDQDDNTAVSAGARLEIGFGTGRVELLRAKGLEEAPTEFGVPAQIGKEVRWELVSNTGERLAE